MVDSVGFSEPVRKAVVAAQCEAQDLGHSTAGIGHLMIAIAGTSTPVAKGLRGLGASPTALRPEVAEDAQAQSSSDGISVEMEEALVRARVEATICRHPQIRTGHVLLAAIRYETGSRLLAGAGVSVEVVRFVIGPRLALPEKSQATAAIEFAHRMSAARSPGDS
jgi:ATP-dependent Clp protease ATP-binding subunit ClpA